MVLLVGRRGPGHRARVSPTQAAGGGPDPFDLGAAGSAALGATYASAIVAISGLAAPTAISVAGGEYAVNGGAWMTAPGSVANGDLVQARGAAPMSAGASQNVALTIGAASGAFTIATVANAETSALVLRFAVDPGESRRGLIDGCIGVLKAKGVWAKLDALYMLAAHDAQAAQRNWIQNAFNITTAGAVTFTADRGYAGDGASGYLDTGFNDLTGSALWSQDAMGLGAYINVPPSGSNYVLGQIGGASVRLGATATAINTRVHSASFNPAFANALPGHIMIVRDGPSSVRCLRNGAQVSAGALTSVAPVNGAITAFRAMNAYSADRAACLHLGGPLTVTEAGDLYAAVLGYLGAIGAN